MSGSGPAFSTAESPRNPWSPPTGRIFIATCEVGYPSEDATPFIHLYINHASSPMLYCKVPLEIVVGTESATWGASKDLF